MVYKGEVMIYAMPTTSYGLSCVVLCEGEAPFPEGAAYPIPANTEPVNMVIDSGVVRVKTEAELQAYAAAVAADEAANEAAKEEAWQLAKSPGLKAVENVYCDFLENMWTPMLRDSGIIPPDRTITVFNTDEATSIYYLLQLRVVNYTNYDKMANEFLRLKTVIVAAGGIMAKVKRT